MSDLKINAENELVIENGDISLTNVENDNIYQNIRQRLRIFKGEWFLDRTMGLPMLDTILVKNPNSVLVATLYKEAIMNTPGVTRLDKYKQVFDLRARKLDITFECTISNGEVLYFEESI